MSLFYYRQNARALDPSRPCCRLGRVGDELVFRATRDRRARRLGRNHVNHWADELDVGLQISRDPGARFWHRGELDVSPGRVGDETHVSRDRGVGSGLHGAGVRCISGRVRASREIEVGASRRVLPGVGRSPLGVGPSRGACPGHRVRRLRASPRVSSFASFGVVGSSPHEASCAVHFRSLLRVTRVRRASSTAMAVGTTTRMLLWAQSGTPVTHERAPIRDPRKRLDRDRGSGPSNRGQTKGKHRLG